MSPNDAVTVCYTVPNDAWKKDGTAFVRLRFTFKRQGRFMKTNILVRKKDMNGARIKNPELREKAEQLLSKIEKCISRLDVFELQKKSIDEVISNVLEGVPPTFAPKVTIRNKIR